MSNNTIKVAIQGIPGSNHDIAVRAFFKKQEITRKKRQSIKKPNKKISTL